MLRAVVFGGELTYDQQVLGETLYRRHSIEILCSLLSNGCTPLALINVLYICTAVSVLWPHQYAGT